MEGKQMDVLIKLQYPGWETNTISDISLNLFKYCRSCHKTDKLTNELFMSYVMFKKIQSTLNSWFKLLIAVNKLYNWTSSSKYHIVS